MRPPRLVVAALVGLAVGLVAWLAARLAAGRLSCRPPAHWLPDWAWPCLDGTGRLVRDLIGMGWDTALPLMLGAAAFLGVGLTGRR